MNTCPSCGSEIVDYLGVDDGGGDYGEAVCDQFACLDCGQMFEDNCIGQAVDGVTYEDDTAMDNPESQTVDTRPYMIDDVGDIPF